MLLYNVLVLLILFVSYPSSQMLGKLSIMKTSEKKKEKSMIIVNHVLLIKIVEHDFCKKILLFEL